MQKTRGAGASKKAREGVSCGDLCFREDISQDTWELHFYDEEEEFVVNSERNAAAAALNESQSLNLNQSQNLNESQTLNSTSGAPKTPTGTGADGDTTPPGPTGLTILGPDGKPLNLNPIEQTPEQTPETLATGASQASAFGTPASTLGGGEGNSAAAAVPPRTPNKTNGRNNKVPVAIQPVAWIPICIGALEDLFRFPEAAVKEEDQQQVFNSTNTTGLSSGDQMDVTAIKKRPITWQGWLPLALWNEQKSVERRQEVRDNPESALSFFIDVVANHCACTGAGIPPGGWPRIDIRLSLVWYPEALENEFVCKRLSQDRQSYQEPSEDHCRYAQNLFALYHAPEEKAVQDANTAGGATGGTARTPGATSSRSNPAGSSSSSSAGGGLPTGQNQSQGHPGTAPGVRGSSLTATGGSATVAAGGGPGPVYNFNLGPYTGVGVSPYNGVGVYSGGHYTLGGTAPPPMVRTYIAQTTTPGFASSTMGYSGITPNTYGGPGSNLHNFQISSNTTSYATPTGATSLSSGQYIQAGPTKDDESGSHSLSATGGESGSGSQQNQSGGPVSSNTAKYSSFSQSQGGVYGNSPAGGQSNTIGFQNGPYFGRTAGSPYFNMNSSGPKMNPVSPLGFSLGPKRVVTRTIDAQGREIQPQERTPGPTTGDAGGGGNPNRIPRG